MANQMRKTNQSANPYLSPNQQDLLLAALNFQTGGLPQAKQPEGGGVPVHSPDSKPVKQPSTMSVSNGDALFASPDPANLDGYDYTPDLEDMDGDGFDFENADLGGDMIGALPGNGAHNVESSNGDGHEKRKSRDEGGEAAGGDAKRQETLEGEKTAKKPGRKPLTNEPTTKRKAQNRAAQRAFRERKEKHLKDLETQVSELTKSAEANKHENGMLKAQVARLEVELREYRNRLSRNDSSVSRQSPPSGASRVQYRSSSGSTLGGNFEFDFPKFGALPGSQIFGRSNSAKLDGSTPSVTKSPTASGDLNRQGSLEMPAASTSQSSTSRSLSPTTAQGSGSNGNSPSAIASLYPSFAAYNTQNDMRGFTSGVPQMNGGTNAFSDLFSPSILKSASVSGYFDGSQATSTVNNAQGHEDNGNDSTSGLNRVFQFNSGSSTSDSTSPSISSSSRWNANGMTNSSCETSPEPSHDSPATKDKSTEPIAAPKVHDEPLYNYTDGVQLQQGIDATLGLSATASNNPSSLTSFDPVLFAGYRESTAGIVGEGDLSGGFFDDALNAVPFDYGSPSDLFGILQSPQQTHASVEADAGLSKAPAPSKKFMAEVERTCGGGDDEYSLSTTQPKHTKGEDVGPLVSCNNIWTQLQSNQDFQDGKFDLDNLCAELRVKARCSESGMLVNQEHFDAALKRLGKKDGKGLAEEPPLLTFEPEN